MTGLRFFLMNIYIYIYIYTHTHTHTHTDTQTHTHIYIYIYILIPDTIHLSDISSIAQHRKNINARQLNFEKFLPKIQY